MLINNPLYRRIAEPYRVDSRKKALLSMPSYNRGVALGGPASLLGVPAPAAPAAPSSSAAMLDYLQTPEIAERLERQRQEDDFSMRRRLGLLQDVPPPEPRPRMPQDTLLGRMGQSVRERAGGLLTGEGSSARLRALGQALLTGPSRTPVSFGQSLMRGLAAGEEAVEREEMAEFAKEQRKAKTSEMKAKQNFVAVMSNPDATDKEQDAAFKKAYPLEWSKAKNKKTTVSQMKAEAVVEVSDGMKEGKELSDFPQVTQDLYKSAVSAGGLNTDIVSAVAAQLGKLPPQTPAPKKSNLPAGTVVKSGGIEYEVQGDGTVKPISR
jgi:hypothetical protein